ncbi:type I DNA topoisomerase [Yeguia hominis]|uniref:DNA topoisomerase 1 n=1 Tax=Yeguia hominis TaxID=2763662 RepID=A0A926D6X9_9FIRM|nr:type I DNA topoisomerase [Yeguia hominis]
MSTLVIVESPNKEKSIKKYLGDGYKVVSSKGHVRDLPAKRLSVDVKKDFQPRYEVIKDKEKLVEDLKKAAEKSDFVLLATDPDREGEAISWHLAYLLGLDETQNIRVTFNEITKSGIEAGMQHQRPIDLDMVNAQQARRILDRLVGYKLSPFLSQKIRRGLSAGRVQSVAVRIVVDREEEIRAFKPEEYWSIDAKFLPKGSKKAFEASFYGTPDEKMKLSSQEETDRILAALEGAEYTVTHIKKGTQRKSPSPPFITSTLQQEAAKKLGFRSARTMKVAQELYEGVDVQGIGAVGLITYMRTDSLRISEEAIQAAAEYIEGRWGKKYLPASPRHFKSRASAQDGHEAIRPSTISLTPDSIRQSLTPDQYKLYKLIWERFIACQMANSVRNTVQADLEGNGYLFKASGYTVAFDGYTTLYEVESEEGTEKSRALPPLEEGMPLKLKELGGNQHFTQPPPRYTEASLIKTLEEYGIGRPSTYAAVISTITGREYVVREGKTLKPTELGEVATQLMKERFPKIVNVKFTAQVETDLDKVRTGEQDWVEMLRGFYTDFEKTLLKAKEEMKDVKIQLKEDQTDIICEKCGRQMVVKFGRYGKFIACPGYPECQNIKKFVQPTPGFCPKCGKKVVARKSKKGRAFYGCEGYPDCDFVTWDLPTDDLCPKCGKTLFRKKGKNGKLYCAAEGCGYERAAEKE